MTDHKCYIAEVGETKQLIDSRDGKKYWVSKLADGNCWMVQNLDFDIPANLSNITSDIVNTSVSTGVDGSTAIKDWNTNGAIARYYNPGSYYYNGPNGTHAQGNTCNTDGNGSNPTLSHCNQFSSTGDSHYHVGNYYSWSAATVKSGDGLTTYGENAPSSICPKGWQLPLSGTDSLESIKPKNTSKTFTKLFESYGWEWSHDSYANNVHGGTNYYIYNAPFYFTYGGNLNSSALNGAGYSSSYWSSTAYSDTNTFSLYFSSSVSPSYNSGRYYGFSVRCVAK